MSDYIQNTQATIELLKTFNGCTTDVGDMIVYRMIDRLRRELRAYLTQGAGL